MPVKTNLNTPAARYFGNIPLFDPAEGVTVREPLGAGPGWWAGAPCGVFDPVDHCYYLYYRMRKPRELGRGVDCRIAASTDGLQFQDIWSATKEQINTQSMEKASLIRSSSGEWMLYLSFVDTDGRWCIELCRAHTIPELDPTKRVRVLGADDLAAEGVKDPCVYNICGLYHMIVSYAPTPAIPVADMHSTGDIYNTGVTKSHTGLATSEDGIHWDWVGDILSPPNQGWDQYCTRIGSIAYAPPFFIGFYDGSASVEDNYEERAGICISTDLRSWERITKAGPFILSPHARRTIRYIEIVQCHDALYYYYEYCRPDGSHELRANKVPLG